MDEHATNSTTHRGVGGNHAIDSNVHRDTSDTKAIVPDVHCGLLNTSSVVSDIHRNKLKSREGADRRIQAVSATRTLVPITEQLALTSS